MTTAKLFGIIVEARGVGERFRVPDRGLANTATARSTCAKALERQPYANLGSGGMSHGGVGVPESRVIAIIGKPFTTEDGLAFAG